MGQKIVCMHWSMNCSADVRDEVGQEVLRIQKTAKAVAALDVFCLLHLLRKRIILSDRRSMKPVSLISREDVIRS